MNQKKYNKKYIVGIAVALLVPLSFYGVIRLLSKDKIVLPPYYHIERVEVRTDNNSVAHDTIYHQVSDLQLVNQFGETVYLNSNLAGKILAISFIDLNDTAAANLQTQNIAILQRAFRKTGMKQNDTIVQFLTVSLHPETDSPQTFRSYAGSYNINQDRWWFLTGRASTVDSLWRYELGLDDVSGHPLNGTIVVLDRERYIRGYYDAYEPLNLRTCANDIGWLAIEKKKKKK